MVLAGSVLAVPRILVIDNYDSFTYNIVQELAESGAEPQVVRNDAWTLDRVKEFAADGIVVSPGPGSPEVARDVGISNEVIRDLGASTPILGVCLGHQCIGSVFGARIVRAPALFHGKTSDIHHRDEGLLKGIPTPFTATRYHSLIVEKATLPDDLQVTAETADGIIMAMRHRTLPIEGVQFHPESILTKVGLQLFSNFVARCQDRVPN